MQYTSLEEDRRKQEQQAAAQNTQVAQTGSQRDVQPVSQTYGTQTQKISQNYRTGGYDPTTDSAYQSAMQRLQTAEKNAPVYSGSYDDQLNALYDKIVNRQPFRYDVNGDQLYQNYRQQYTTLGRQAMADTMGQAAGLTGGYGSTYSQMAGQQAYDAYLQRLNDKVPELAAAAQSAYESEGNRMAQQYSMLGDLRDTEYSRYQDDYTKWLTERSYAQQEADNAYSRGQQQWQTNYGIMQDNQQLLMSLIGSTGYNATDEELAAAGLTRAQADALRNQWIADNAPKSGGGYYRKSPTEEASGTKTSNKTKHVIEMNAHDALSSGLSSDDVSDLLVSAGASKAEALSAVKKAEKYAKYVSGALSTPRNFKVI